MEERLRFVARLLEGEGMSEVCREFGISRKTGYKIFNRYKEDGLEALCDRSRRPVRYANQLPHQIERLIVESKRDNPRLFEAKRRFTKASCELEQHWEFLRSKPVPIPQKQIVALAGEAYHGLLRGTDEEPGEPFIWRTLRKRLDREQEAGNLEGWYGETADQLLSRHGMKADQSSRERLLEEIHKAIKQAANYSLRRAEGDYRPDPAADRFPLHV